MREGANNAIDSIVAPTSHNLTFMNVEITDISVFTPKASNSRHGFAFGIGKIHVTNEFLRYSSGNYIYIYIYIYIH